MLVKNFDFLILLAVVVVASLGLTILWSVAPALLSQQFIFLILGFILFFSFSRIDFRLFAHFKWFFYLFPCFLLLLTFFFGSWTRGAVRWIEIGPLRLQPSELAKPFLIVFFASFLSSGLSFKRVLVSFFLLLIPLFLVFKQPDLGNTLILLAFFTTIVIMGGLRPIFIWLGTFLVGGLTPFFWYFLKDYQKERLISFLNPYHDPLGAGYNLFQAMIAVGSGQIIGRGLGRGTQSHLQFLPEHHTDFIFASLAEELGFVGSFILLFAYGLLLWRILKTAERIQDPFGVLICGGVFGMLLTQIFINIGMNIGLLPITGITLPLVSYGGSSLISTLLSLGLVESVAREIKRKETLEIR